MVSMNKRPQGMSKKILHEKMRRNGWAWSYWPCRCNRRGCQSRRTLRKHPDEYINGRPKCRVCGVGKMYLDTYRATRAFRDNDLGELCKCDRYHYPHAKGRGYCFHSGKYDDRPYRNRLDPDVYPDPDENPSINYADLDWL